MWKIFTWKYPSFFPSEALAWTAVLLKKQHAWPARRAPVWIWFATMGDIREKRLLWGVEEVMSLCENNGAPLGGGNNSLEYTQRLTLCLISPPSQQTSFWDRNRHNFSVTVLLPYWLLICRKLSILAIQFMLHPVAVELLSTLNSFHVYHRWAESVFHSAKTMLNNKSIKHIMKAWCQICFVFNLRGEGGCVQCTFWK